MVILYLSKMRQFVHHKYQMILYGGRNVCTNTKLKKNSSLLSAVLIYLFIFFVYLILPFSIVNTLESGLEWAMYGTGTQLMFHRQKK